VAPGQIDSRRQWRPRRGRLALVVGGVMLTATGCSTEDMPRLGMPIPATDQARRILHLWQGSWIAALSVGALVWGLIVWSIIFYRRRSAELPPQVRFNLPIEALYTAVPFVIISVLFYFVARDETKLLEIPDRPDQTINVVGRQWNWSFNYLDQDVWDAGTPAQPVTLYLPKGETILFELTSPDVIHSFWVPNFLFKMDVIPGRVNKFALTPSREGRFAGRCAELCGVDHSRMQFSVQVVSRDVFDQKMAELRAAGQTGSLPRGITEPNPGSLRVETGGEP
jgi:cytochrome c oxidase subunit 2